MNTPTKLIAAAALAMGVAFSAQACKVNRATGQTICMLSGSETGWAAKARMVTVDGEPFLLLFSDGAANRIKATEVSFRPEGGEAYRLPVHAGGQSCFWATPIVDSCLSQTHVYVRMDAASLERLAATPVTYVAAVDGKSVGPDVKVKGAQVRAWIKQLGKPAP